MTVTDREVLVNIRSVLRNVLAEVEDHLTPALSAPEAVLIVVDAGHGGSDPGAIVPGVDDEQKVLEKTITLRCSLELAQVLEHAGYQVVLTRKDDLYVGLTDRTRMANEADAYCFISLHANAASTEARNGAWVLYDDRTSDKNGIALSVSIFDSLSNVPGITDDSPQREIFPDGTPWVGGRQLTILSRTRMPAVLVEMGFMTNPADLVEMTDYQQEIVEAIADGIISWHKERDHT